MVLDFENDFNMYRDKGTRQTSIKTVCGELEYGRHAYKNILEDGTRVHNFCLTRKRKWSND